MNVCLFDIDGTLIDSHGAGGGAMLSALSEEFTAVAQTRSIAAAGRTDRAIVTDLFADHGVDPTPANRERFHAEYIQRLPAVLRERQGVVLPGVVGLLDALQAHSRVALGLLTGNYQQGARLKLEHFGLYKYFAFGGFGDEHLDRDDVARSALTVVQDEFTDGYDRVVVIGDTPADVQCGRAIGAITVAVATGMFSPDELAVTEPDHLFESLADTAACVAAFTD